MIRHITSHSRGTTLPPALVLAALLAAPSAVGQALTDRPAADAPWAAKPVQLDLHDASLDDALKALHERAGVNAVADGEPFRKSVTLSLQCAAREALERVAEAFDYQWSLGPGGVALLRKRFTDSEDLPQLHRAELLRTAQDLTAALRGFDYDPDPAHVPWIVIRKLAPTLTADQMAALKRSERLPFASLSPVQQSWVQRAVLTNALAGVRMACERLLVQMSDLESSSLRRVPLAQSPTSFRYELKHFAGPDAYPVVQFIGDIQLPASEAPK